MYVKHDLSVCVSFLFVLTTVRTNSENSVEKTYHVDTGRNLTLPCPVQHDRDVMWVREGRRDDEDVPGTKLTVQDDGSLLLVEVDKNDSGIYSCTRPNALGDDQTARLKVVVRTAPPPLVDVSVHASTILAVIIWGVTGNGGYPITYFTAEYRLADSDEEWLEISPIHIPPNSRQIDVYKLEPNTTYAFRVWAVNQLGESDVSVVYSTTKVSNEPDQLQRMFLDGIKNFDTRIWAIAVGIVMGTLVILGFGTCFLLYQECRSPGEIEDQEIIELVPNIILNPGFEGNDGAAADENSNSEATSQRLNNNTVVRPRHSNINDL